MRNSPQALDRAGILERVPHQGGSCLLDRLCRWDEHSIVCETQSHLLADNPYRFDGKLSAVCAVEYAAQTFALHVHLKSSTPNAPPLRGYLASARDFLLSVSRLDTCLGPLTITAEVLAIESRIRLYSFNVLHQHRVIAGGRAAVAVPATQP